MNEIGLLLSQGWDVALGTWPLLLLAALLWLVMMVTALRRITARRRGGLALALLAGGWACAAALALSPELARSLMAEPHGPGRWLLLVGLAALGLLASRPRFAQARHGSADT